jgi:hypothetical protein
MPIGKQLIPGVLLCLALAAATADHSFNVDVPRIPWAPMHLAGTPDGRQARSLHESPRTKMSSKRQRSCSTRTGHLIFTSLTNKEKVIQV